MYACAQDFRELMIHHFITITLLSVSWANNNVRVGTLVLVSHDVNDIILEGGKLLKYLKKETVCDVLFAFFLLSWLLTRLIYFPLAYVPPSLRLSLLSIALSFMNLHTL